MGSARQNRNRKQTVLERVKAIPHKTFIVVVLGIALIGTTLQILTPAQGSFELHDIPSDTRISFTNDGNINGYQDPSYNLRESTISVDIEPYGNLAKSQILVFYTYNIKVLAEPIKVTCHWRHGCFKSGWDGPRRQFTHGARIVTCHNVPANFRADRARVVTFKTHLKTIQPSTDEAIDNMWYGYAKGSCQSNPRAKGLVITHSIDGCEATYSLCGPVGGSVPSFVGFTPLKTGNGNGGTGTGTNGDGDGDGPGRGNDPGPGQGPSPAPTGGSGGGGGSTAQRQADKPNPLPKSVNRGTTTKQPKLEPSPFFDGKQYKRGSETDNYTIGTILSSTGSTIAKGLPFAIGAIAIAGTGFAVYWRVWRK